MLCENLIPFKYSFKSLPSTIMWLQAKPIGQSKNYSYTNEYCLVYINSASFIQGWQNGELTQTMKRLKEFATRQKEAGEDASYKVVVLFNSVGDSLFNPKAKGPDAIKPHHQGGPNLQDLHRFQLSLTLEYEFDYLEVFTPIEVIDFLKEMHLSILDKPFRKELSMYSRKGFRPGNKAKMAGLSDELSLTFVSWLMCVPGLSENKAIGIAKAFPTYKVLMDSLTDPKLSEKERKTKLAEVELASIAGEKPKKLGKAMAEKIYTYFMSADPNVSIS